MEILDGARPLPDCWRSGVVALGNFDGVHLGHQAVVARAFDRARQAGRPALVVTFDPHPVQYFKPDAPPFRLTTVAQRARLLAELGVDAMVVLPFDAALAGLDAPDFFARILVERFGIGGLVTGEGFHFGRKRSGDVALLRRLGGPIGVEVDAEVPVTLGGETVSSTRIRAAIRAGECVAAADLLSRPFVIEGIAVAADDAAGGTNIAFDDYVRPRAGPYRVRIRSGDATWRGTATSITGSAIAGDDRLWLPKSFSASAIAAELLHPTEPSSLIEPTR